MKKQRIVVKIGSSSLTNGTGGICKEKLRDHVAALAALKRAGHEVVLITSGAVAAGFTALGYPSRPVTIKGKQAAAAVGQGLLMQAYTEELNKYGIIGAQLLLTRGDFSRKEQYSNAYATLSELLERSALPIINENDSVSIEELTFGDNDMLSALVSGLVYADTLIILTDINGLYDKNPHEDPTAKKYHFLPSITEEVLALAGGSGSKVGTGGMKSKLDAAKTAVSLGVSVFIGTGHGEQKLLDILQGKGDGTYIGNAPQKVIKNHKQWIALHSFVSGQIEVDNGAAAAVLEQGKSLLAAGVLSVHGSFLAGDVVEVISPKGKVLGKGQVNYSAAELQHLKGKQSREIQLHKERSSYEVIHRDNWVSL
ncbi:MAG: glutamate 5-kinase [Ectobacillus sp.]